MADFPEQGRHRSDDAARRPGRFGLTALVVVVVFFLIGAGGVLAITKLAGSGSTVLPTTPNSSSASTPAGAAGERSAVPAPTPTTPAPVPTGPQTDGVLRFRSTGSTTSGGALTATVTVTNLSTAWTPFYGENQSLVGVDGKLVAAQASLTYLESKETQSVQVTFGLPAGFQPAYLRLRAAAGSVGVTQPLRPLR